MDPTSKALFWKYLDRLVADHALIIDRRKGWTHPRYPDLIYPLDYGYLEGTTSIDQGGIDVWVGKVGCPNDSASSSKVISAVILTVDLVKNDAEIKIALNCDEEDVQTILAFHNGNKMGAVVVRRPIG